MSAVFLIFQLLPVIIWFLFIGVFVRIVIRAVSNGKKPGNGKGQQPGYGSASQMNQNTRQTSSYNTGANRKAQKYPTQDGRGTFQTQKSERATGQTAQDSEVEMSTLEYLEERARQDDLEHEAEERRQRMLDKQRSGGASPGVRLYEGDSVPAGMRPVRCEYCGADNLVPTTARGKYTCYFCREEL